MFESRLPGYKVRTLRSVFGSDLHNWLSLRFLWAPDGCPAYFHDLVWLQRNGDEWDSELVISHFQFQDPSILKRWIHDLHSFNSIEATAIIKVGEANTPSLSTSFNYTWRRLALRSMDTQVLQHCCPPLEPYAGGG
jgi:hypothetical protein